MFQAMTILTIASPTLEKPDSTGLLIWYAEARIVFCSDCSLRGSTVRRVVGQEMPAAILSESDTWFTLRTYTPWVASNQYLNTTGMLEPAHFTTLWDFYNWRSLPCGFLSWSGQDIFRAVLQSEGLPTHSPFSFLSVWRSQICIGVWDPPSILSLPLPSILYSLFPNESFALLILPWHLLPRGPEKVHDAIESTLPQNVSNWIPLRLYIELQVYRK